MSTTPLDSSRPVRVAIVGARGIGKHHAKWWHLEGADVCAFAGASADSLDGTSRALRDLFPFAGRGYADVAAMIEAERPDIVDVCSATPCHYEHARLALEAGVHVLCEKPLVYDPSLPSDVLRAQARALIDLARSKGLRFGVCTQYALGARLFTQLWRARHPGEAIVHMHAHLESPAKNRPPDPRRIWVDLSPHLLSVLLHLAPEGVIVPGSLKTKFVGYENIAEFDFRSSAEETLHALIVTRNAVQPPFNIRHAKFNGYPFVVEGENDADGVYRARIETPDGPHIVPDMMHALIRDFLHDGAAVDLEVSFRNLDLMLHIMDAVGDIS